MFVSIQIQNFNPFFLSVSLIFQCSIGIRKVSSLMIPYAVFGEVYKKAKLFI